MIKLGLQNIEKFYAGNVKICSAYLGEELVFEGGCEDSYRWIGDESSVICEQTEDITDTATLISEMKSPFMVEIRNNLTEMFLLDYYDEKIYKINLAGLNAALNKKGYIYSCPSATISGVTSDYGGGMVYDPIRDEIYVYTSFSTNVRVIKCSDMSLDRTISLTGVIDIGVGKRSRPTYNQNEVLFFGNGGYLRVPTDPGEDPLDQGHPSLNFTYAVIHNGDGYGFSDLTEKKITKYNTTDGTIISQLNLSTYGSTWRGFYFHKRNNMIYFIDNNSSNGFAYLVALNLTTFTIANRVQLPNNSSTGTISATNIAFHPIKGFLYISGKVGSKLSVWRYSLACVFQSGYTSTVSSEVTDTTYNPQTNKMFAINRGVISNQSDGALFYIN